MALHKANITDSTLINVELMIFAVCGKLYTECTINHTVEVGYIHHSVLTLFIKFSIIKPNFIMLLNDKSELSCLIS